MLCRTCLSDKPESAFYASNLARCKECVKASVRANRREKIDYYRQYDKMRASMPHRVAARKEYSLTERGKEAHTRANRKWTLLQPKRKAASWAVNNAIRDGKLKRQPCWVCGSKAHAHHPDYDRPLDVVWLCPAHHKQAHALVANEAQFKEQA